MMANTNNYILFANFGFFSKTGYLLYCVETVEKLWSQNRKLNKMLLRNKKQRTIWLCQINGQKDVYKRQIKIYVKEVQQAKYKPTGIMHYTHCLLWMTKQ